jgi:predicted dehydrogenase
MKIALLGTGFGQAHAAVYAQRPDVDQVVVFGRTPSKLAAISGQFGFTTTTGLDALIADPPVDLVDICLPTALHAEVAVRAMQAGKDVLIELPLASTRGDAHRIIAAQRATGRKAFVGMFSRFSPANQQWRPKPWPISGMGRCRCWRSRAAPRCCGRDTTSAWIPSRWT